MTTLTNQQQSVLSFIERELTAGKPCPSLREIAAHFGFVSKTAVVSHIRALVKKGALAVDSGKARSLRLVKSFHNHGSVFEIPVLGAIPAGFASEREQENGECVPVTNESIGFKPTRQTFALRVTGDSMIGRHVCDGDIVVFEHGQEPRSGEIVAALIDGKNTLKTFVMKGGKPFLKAENPKYPNLIPSEELVIQGVFRTLIRKANNE
jgi:repressor LexA